MPDRRQQILDAAIEVLGTRGMRQLTHRAVDARAGLPPGSTSNRFRTREALLCGVLERVLEHETAVWNRLAEQLRPVGPDAFADAVGQLIRELSGDGRSATLARHAVFAEAGHHPVLRRKIAEERRRLAAWAAPLLAGLGSPDPPVHLQVLLAFLDGVLAHRLVDPAPDLDPATAVRALLRGLFTDGGRRP